MTKISADEAGRKCPTARRVLRLLAGAATVGAAVGAVMYYADHKMGSNRRRHALALGRHAGRRLHREIRHLGAEAFGVEQRLEHRHPAPPSDDLTLLDRVESEVFARGGIPKGAILFDVERGVITIRGEVPAWEDADRYEAVVRSVDGVKDVNNLLHLPHTPSPNKVEAIVAGRGARKR